MTPADELPSLADQLSGTVGLWERSSQRYYADGMKAAEKEIVSIVVNHAPAIVAAIRAFSIPQSMTPAEMREMAPKSIAAMVIEWVNGGISHGMDWRIGLRNIIAKRLARFPIPDTTAADDALEAQRRAIDRMLTGGNHLALYADEWPAWQLDGMTRGQQCENALRRMGATKDYDVWCCYSAMMQARDELYEALAAIDAAKAKGGER